MASTELHLALEEVVGPGGVVSNADELVVYECDGFTIPRSRPLAVVFPRTTAQVAAVITILRERKIAIMARGSGTGLTGGIVAVVPGVQVSLARMNHILEIDLRNRYALVEAGVINWALSLAIATSPYHFAPDPSSQRASTIGGNAATNAGGLHTLKYGVTVNHILGLEVVLEDGTIHQLGGPHGHDIGPDLAGLFCGTEGTLGIITKVWCRLTPKPLAFRTAVALFHKTIDACQAVADIIAAGIIPAALEMMDGTMIAIVEDTFHLGIPKTAQDGGALLLIEVDGPEIGIDHDLADITALCKKNAAFEIQSSSDPQRRAELWSARRRSFAAIGRVSPSYCTQDACVPRSKLPQVITRLGEICARHQMRVTNVFHAGDGNVHPVLMYDEADPDSVRRALAASGEILRYCASIGGTITGEHGIGIEKLSHLQDMFSPSDIAAMHKIRTAFVPQDQMNPYKTLPRPGIEIDLMSPGRKVPQ
ncbi:MAG TPA: FAD-linked oxidase C-terminal domain-containing protein [Phycisphaerae bacterium]|jgi:glycolate oxidase